MQLSELKLDFTMIGVQASSLALPLGHQGIIRASSGHLPPTIYYYNNIPRSNFRSTVPIDPWSSMQHAAIHPADGKSISIPCIYSIWFILSHLKLCFGRIKCFPSETRVKHVQYTCPDTRCPPVHLQVVGSKSRKTRLRHERGSPASTNGRTGNLLRTHLR